MFHIYVREEKPDRASKQLQPLRCRLIQRLIAFFRNSHDRRCGVTHRPPQPPIAAGPLPFVCCMDSRPVTLKSSLCGLMVSNYPQRGSDCGQTGRGCCRLIYGWPSGRRHHRSACDCRRVEFTPSCELITGVIYQ